MALAIDFNDLTDEQKDAGNSVVDALMDIYESINNCVDIRTLNKKVIQISGWGGAGKTETISATLHHFENVVLENRRQSLLASGYKTTVEDQATDYENVVFGDFKAAKPSSSPFERARKNKERASEIRSMESVEEAANMADFNVDNYFADLTAELTR